MAWRIHPIGPHTLGGKPRSCACNAAAQSWLLLRVCGICSFGLSAKVQQSYRNWIKALYKRVTRAAKPSARIPRSKPGAQRVLPVKWPDQYRWSTQQSEAP
jgi:hypothetical protein